MIGFTIRNLRVFFKDKSSVFFSLLAVFIIIGLYALFLGDVWLNSLEGTGMIGVRYLMDSWIMAGLLAVTSVTTTMGAYGILVEDRAKKIDKDFRASPVSRRSIVGGYIANAILVGIVMSLITVVLAEIYIVAGGGQLMSFPTLCRVLLLIVLATLTNSSMVLFLVSFFKSVNAFATASTVLGTLIGFLTGIYLPIGNLPEGVQWVVKLFPVSHAAVLFRQVMMAKPLAASFEGAPAQSLEEFEEMMGITFFFGQTEVAPWMSVLILLGTGAVFFALALLQLSRKRKTV